MRLITFEKAGESDYTQLHKIYSTNMANINFNEYSDSHLLYIYLSF